MTPSEIFNNIVTAITNPNLLGKFILIILIAVYTLYAIILARQIFFFSPTAKKITYSVVLQFLAILHLFVAMGLLLYAIILL